jgi:NAD(P)H-hydrate epimerase
MSRAAHVPVCTAAESAALDARTIATMGGGDASYALMTRAATRAAEWLLASAIRGDTEPSATHAIEASVAGRLRDALHARRIAVCCGPGNNGGDGWLVAGALRRAGHDVRVHAPLAPRTDDARRARHDAEGGTPFPEVRGDEPLVIDALLGTGARGAVRAPLDDALARLRTRATDGAVVVALDLPSGLDATTGESHGAPHAACTLSFGSAKRGQLLRRDLVGALVVLDIALDDAPPSLPRLVTASWARTQLPPLPVDAYKATRGRLRIVGGGPGMAGAVILAARGAHASGAGMVRCAVAEPSVLALQVAAPFATVEPWMPDASWPTMEGGWPHATVIGPGIDGGDSPDSAQAARVRAEVERLLGASRGPVLLDGGALTAFAGRADALARALDGRPALLTPHVGEFARLMGRRDSHTAIDRFADPARLAATTGATVLFKGVPTIVASPDGTVRVVAYGNPALAMGGSGDLLAGIGGTLLAQGLDPLVAGCVAAWAHGAAATRATTRHGGWRGTTMDALVDALAGVWHASPDDAREHGPHVLARLHPVPVS